VLWDPVLSGSDYLTELARSHVGFIAGVFRWSTERAARSRGINALDELEELVGFEISGSLRREISAIRHDDLGVPETTRVVVLGNETGRTYAPWLAGLRSRGLAADYVPVDDDTPWNSEEALNASTIPARTLDALLAAVEKPA
jgi:hypothetical protein